MLARGHRESPCGEWISNICLRVDPYGMAKSLEKVMSANLERLQSLRLLSGKRIDIAIDIYVNQICEHILLLRPVYCL